MIPGHIGSHYGPHAAAFTVGYIVFSYAAVPEVVTREFDIGFAEVGLLMSAALGAFTVVLKLEYPDTNDQTIPWWWTENRDDLRHHQK